MMILTWLWILTLMQSLSSLMDLPHVGKNKMDMRKYYPFIPDSIAELMDWDNPTYLSVLGRTDDTPPRCTVNVSDENYPKFKALMLLAGFRLNSGGHICAVDFQSHTYDVCLYYQPQTFKPHLINNYLKRKQHD